MSTTGRRCTISTIVFGVKFGNRRMFGMRVFIRAGGIFTEFVRHGRFLLSE